MMADTLSFTAKVDLVNFWVYNLTTRDSPKWTLESGPCVSGSGRLNRLGSKRYPKIDQINAKWYSPSQVWPQTMCHTHSWPQHASCQWGGAPKNRPGSGPRWDTGSDFCEDSYCFTFSIHFLLDILFQFLFSACLCWFFFRFALLPPGD